MTESDRVVYLDYAATTPVDPAVVAAMTSCLGPDGDFGNSGSVTHRYGLRAAKRVEQARAAVASLLSAQPEEIVFTSGATESNNLAVLGIARANKDRGRHIVTSRIEHKAVLDPCKRLEKEGYQVTWLSPDGSGRVSPESVRAALRTDTVLVSIMLANNEIGVLQDIPAIGAICQDHGVALHTDAAQAVGKIPVDVRVLPVEVLSFTAHKLYGPKGVGALYVRPSARSLLQPILFGGGQERGLRPGTLATHQIAGLGAACELAQRLQSTESRRLADYRERLWQGIRNLGGVHLNGAGAEGLPGLLNVSFEGVEGESLVAGMAELAVSTGSACNSAVAEPSYVLRALGRDSQLAQSSIRFSMGRFTGVADVDTAIAVVNREVRRLRRLSPAWDDTADMGVPSGLGQVTGEAGAASQGTWVRFRLFVAGKDVKEAHLQAYGCPHTVAVATWLAQQLPGRDREALQPGVPGDWAAQHQVPVEKLGRLLVIEDALQACSRQWPEAT